jgi:predicted dehydrogenase
MTIAFCKDLLNDPASRDTTDVSHEIVAVASSSSADRASSFIQKIGGPSSAKPYGSYAELVADSNVDIIYVATPHSHHLPVPKARKNGRGSHRSPNRNRP